MSQTSFPLPRDANFTEEQHALAEVAGDLFAKVNPPSRIRALWDADEPRPRDVWQQLAEVGLTAIGVPDAHGGMGGDAADLVLALEHVGRTLLPEPLSATAAVAVPILAEVGGEVADQWLPAIASGAAMATVSLGGAPWVLDADDADLVLVERENTLWLETQVAHPQRVRSEDGSRRVFARPELRGQMLGGAELLREAQLRSAAATAAELVGVCAALLDQCVEYARLRKQFDTPIGGFQAIQHTLADLFVGIESARGAVRHAARRLAAEADDRAEAVSIAKAASARIHRQVNTDALQVFGGIGFTWEHDLHLWLKRGLALEVQDGDERHHRRLLAAALLDKHEDEDRERR